jgi:hypothetical protein
VAASLVQTLDAAVNAPGSATTTVNFSAASAGNLLLLTVAADDYRTTSGAGRPESTGWTLPTGGAQETFLGHYLWYKAAAGGETSVQYTIGTAAPSCWCFAEYSGMDSSPYDISAGQLAQSTLQTYTTPAITPTAGERLLVATIGGSAGGAWPSLDRTTWLNSFVEVADIGTTLASGTRDIQGMADFAVTANGSTAYSSGATYPAVAQSRTGIVIAFKVASGGATPLAARPLVVPNVAVHQASNY